MFFLLHSFHLVAAICQNLELVTLILRRHLFALNTFRIGHDCSKCYQVWRLRLSDQRALTTLSPLPAMTRSKEESFVHPRTRAMQIFFFNLANWCELFSQGNLFLYEDGRSIEEPIRR